MDRNTGLSLSVTCSDSDWKWTRDQFWGQNNAAEHNDSSSDRIDYRHCGSCHCQAVRPFCLPRRICSGTEAGKHSACDALAFSARTPGERFETVLRRYLRPLSQFAQPLPFEITRKPGAGLESRPRLSDRYLRQKLRGSQLPSSGRNSNFFCSNRSKWIAHGVLSMFFV